MYDAVIGRKGSGKSYNVVKTVILPALRKGRKVVTNIPLTEEIELDPDLTGTVIFFDLNNITEDFFKAENVHKGAVYVLDEIHKRWSSGMQVTEFPESEKLFITEHRHMVGEDGYSTDVVLVTQDTRQLAAYPRNLLDKTYRCRNYAAVGQKDVYRVDIFDGCVSLEYKASDPKIKSLKGKYDSEIYKYYSSHTMNDSTYDSGMEEESNNSNIFKSPKFYFGVPLLIAFFIFGFYAVSDFFDFSDNFDQSSSVDVSDSSLSSFELEHGLEQRVNFSSLDPLQNEPADLPFSTLYRLSHYVNSGAHMVAYITDNTKVFPIPLGDCKQIIIYGMTCVFFGHIVNFYSGEAPKYETQSYNPIGS